MSVADRVPQVSQYGSVDPAPPSREVEQLSGEDELSALRTMLLDENNRMFERMRAVFSLRNLGSDEACLVICEAFQASSALLRHELAYVLGQMQNPVALPTLTERLADEEEHVMVRHEAAEAMGAIGDQSSIPHLEKYLKSPFPEVSESCEVALDLLNWCNRAEWDDQTW